MKPLVSVIMSCYNHERYVQEAIYSVINQSYSNIELIIFNDGSRDGCDRKILELVEICKARFECFQYIDKPNEGVAVTLNKGLALSKGEYITFCASDDRYVEKYIDVAVGEFLQLDASFAMVSGDANFIDSNGQEVFFNEFYNIIYDRSTAIYRSLKELTCEYDPDEFISGYGTYKHVITGRCGFTQATMFLKHALIDVGMFSPNNRVEDVGLCLRIAKKYKVKFVDEVLYNYRLHGSNSVTQHTALLSKDIVRLLSDEQEYCFSNGLVDEWRSRNFMELNTILRHGDYRFVGKFIIRESLEGRYAWYVARTIFRKIKKRLVYFFNMELSRSRSLKHHSK